MFRCFLKAAIVIGVMCSVYFAWKEHVKGEAYDEFAKTQRIRDLECELRDLRRRK